MLTFVPQGLSLFISFMEKLSLFYASGPLRTALSTNGATLPQIQNPSEVSL
jgi:hypothetical protein